MTRLYSAVIEQKLIAMAGKEVKMGAAAMVQMAACSEAQIAEAERVASSSQEAGI
jgi:hypothetical protein